MAAVDTMFDVCFGQVCLSEHMKQKGKPGEAYQSLPESIKDELQKLTSNDMHNMRGDLVKLLVWSRQDSERERLHKLLLDFDAKMNDGKI